MQTQQKAREVRARLKLLESTEQRDAFVLALEKVADGEAAYLMKDAALIMARCHLVEDVADATELLAKMGIWWIARGEGTSTITPPSLTARVRAYLEGVEQ